MLFKGQVRSQRGGEGDRWKLKFLEEQLTVLTLFDAPHKVISDSQKSRKECQEEVRYSCTQIP